MIIFVSSDENSGGIYGGADVSETGDQIGKI